MLDTRARPEATHTMPNKRSTPMARPLWSSFRTETRGFWSKKTVLFAALVAKAAVVAALLLR